jgi:hypothetical protein
MATLSSCLSYKKGNIKITAIIKLHADGNLTSKLIEQYSAAGC